MEDRTPIFFKQKRVGKDMKPFTIYKLRTMKNSAPELGTHEVESTFYLNVGQIIRNLKIDEFPQFLNVIEGRLSLVGPRPCLFNQKELLEARLRKKLLGIRPGVTGITQIFNVDMSYPEEQSTIDNAFYKDNKNQLKLYFLAIFSTFIPPLRPLLRKYLNIIDPSD